MLGVYNRVYIDLEIVFIYNCNEDLMIFRKSKYFIVVVNSVDYILIIKMFLLCVMIFKMNKFGLKNSCYFFLELRCVEFKCFEYISIYFFLII